MLSIRLRAHNKMYLSAKKWILHDTVPFKKRWDKKTNETVFLSHIIQLK